MSADQAVALVEEPALVVAVAQGVAWVVPAQLRPLAGTSRAVWVETQGKSACGSCPSSAGCATPVLGHLGGAHTTRLQVDDHLGLRVGEAVVLGIPDGDLLRAAALAYLIPPAALVLGAGLAGTLGIGDLGSALTGILALTLGLLVTRFMTGGGTGREGYRPVLVRRQPAIPGPNIDFTFHQVTRGT